MIKARNLDLIIGIDVFADFLPSVGMVPMPHPFTGILMNPMDYLPPRAEVKFSKNESGTSFLKSNLCVILSVASSHSVKINRMNKLLPMSLRIALPGSAANEISDVPVMRVEDDIAYPIGLPGLKKLTRLYSKKG